MRRMRTRRVVSVAALLALCASGCGDAASPTAPNTPNAPNQPATVTVGTVTLAAASATAGETIAGTVTLSGAAPGAGTTVSITSSDAAASVPASIVVAAGATSGTFTVTTATVTALTDVTITASAGGASRTAILRVTPTPPSTGGPIASITSRHDDIIGGGKTTGTVTLTDPAPGGGMRISLSSDDADVSVPSSLTIAAGRTTGTFEIATEPVLTAKTVGITIGLANAARARRVATADDSAVLTITLLPKPATPPAPPTLANLSPSGGVQGTSVSVTLTGSNFVAGADIGVSGAGVAVSGISVDSATSISATFAIDAGAATGARTVTVTTAGGTTGGRTFTVNAPDPEAPALTGINPASGLQGTSVDVTLTGTHFLAGATVAVSGAGVTVSNVDVDSATSITATLAIAANAAAGARTVTVTTAGGTSGGRTFTVNAPDPEAPTLTGINPASGVQGASVDVTLTGTNFLAGATVGASGTGVTVSNIVVASATSITARLTIAAGAATGARNVTVATAGGTSGGRTFTIGAPAPTLTSITPVSGVQGTTVDVTLTGTDFIAGASVNVSGSGITVSDVSVDNSTTISATLDISASAALGARTATVTTAGGTSGGRTFALTPHVVAVDDAYTAKEFLALTITAGTGVLANDTDADGDPLTVTLVSEPANGDLTLNADGSFTYTSDEDYHGADGFTYQATDGDGMSASASVAITVTENHAPVAAAGSASGDEGIVCLLISWSATDVDDDELTFAISTPPTEGLLFVYDTSAPFGLGPQVTTTTQASTLCYKPNQRFFHGTDAFQFTASDGRATSSPATISITINDIGDEPDVRPILDVNLHARAARTDRTPRAGHGIPLMRYLLDANAVIALLNDTTSPIARRIRRHAPRDIGVSAVVILELPALPGAPPHIAGVGSHGVRYAVF